MLIATSHCKARGFFKWNPEYTSQVLISLYTAFNCWRLFIAKLERGKWLILYFSAQCTGMTLCMVLHSRSFRRLPCLICLSVQVCYSEGKVYAANRCICPTVLCLTKAILSLKMIQPHRSIFPKFSNQKIVTYLI